MNVAEQALQIERELLRSIDRSTFRWFRKHDARVVGLLQQLGELADAESLPTVVLFLASPSQSIREAARRAIAGIVAALSAADWMQIERTRIWRCYGTSIATVTPDSLDSVAGGQFAE